MNANIEIAFFAIFSKTTFWTYVVCDLDGSIGVWTVELPEVKG